MIVALRLGVYQCNNDRSHIPFFQVVIRKNCAQCKWQHVFRPTLCRLVVLQTRSTCSPWQCVYRDILNQLLVCFILFPAFIGFLPSESIKRRKKLHAAGANCMKQIVIIHVWQRRNHNSLTQRRRRSWYILIWKTISKSLYLINNYLISSIAIKYWITVLQINKQLTLNPSQQQLTAI